jgi:hypothetical protein
MKIRTLLSYLVVFLAGFAVARFSKEPEAVVQEMQPVARTSQHQSFQSKTAPAKAASRNALVDDLLIKFNDVKNLEKKSEVLAEIETAELLSLIEAISQKAGLTGLGFREIALIELLLIEWSSRDFDSALGWANGILNTEDRKRLLHVLIGQVAHTDCEKAMDLVHQYCRNNEGGWDIPYDVARKTVASSADQMLKMVGQFVSTVEQDPFGSGGYVEAFEAVYPPSFNFRKALDGLVKLRMSLKEGESLAIYPINLMNQWAQIDPEAAWHWLGENKDVDYAGVSNFLEGYSQTANAEETLQMLLQSADRFVTTDAHIASAWRVIASLQNAEMLSRFLEQAPGDRAEKMMTMFEISRESSGGHHDLSKSLLISQMNYEERMSVFSQEQDYLDHERKFYTPILQRLGHTEAEIQQMLPVKKSP